VTETYRTDGGNGVLRIERRLAHPPEKVWRAVTEPEHLRHWFPFEVQVDLSPGGKIAFSQHGDSTGPATSGRVLAADPPRVFAFSWEADELRFDLRPDGAGTLLVFTHTFADRAGAASFTAGWMTCLDALELVLDDKPVDRAPDMARMDAQHEHYVTAFGLAEGTVAATADGWEVRFERQLTRPAATVWAALADSAPATVDAAPPKAFTTGEIPAGPVTAVEAPRVLEYEWQLGAVPAGRVRWELAEGTGQGARLILTQSGPGGADAEQAIALAAWRARVETLAAHLLTIKR
jgi:uncharacterized protein YndB with AHSA1/START domain